MWGEGSRWLQGIGSGWSHVFRGQRCELVCVSVSVFTGVLVLACQYMLIWKKKNARGVGCLSYSAQNGKTEWIAIQINWRLQMEQHDVETHVHTLQRKDMTYQAMCDFLCLACRKPPDGKERSQQKKKYDQFDFLLAFYFTISSSVNEILSDLRHRLLLFHFPFVLSFFLLSLDLIVIK